MAIISNELNKKQPDTTWSNNAQIKEVRIALKQVKSLEEFLDRGQEEKFFSLLSELIGSMKRYQNDDSGLSLQIYYSLSSMFLSFIERWGMNSKLTPQIDPSTLIGKNDTISWETVAADFDCLAHAIFQVMKNDSKETKYDAIQFLLQYIDDHYTEDIPLENLSQLVHLNPAYLSGLFKKVVGTTISAYIHRLRLERSKILLDHSNFKIYEIAAAVGYESPQYFSKIFKESAHMAPQKYRERNK